MLLVKIYVVTVLVPQLYEPPAPRCRAGIALSVVETPDPAEALRMSYYTGPSEMPLIPLRLTVAVHLDELGDSELQQFAQRDLRVLIAHQEKPAVVQAYQSATPAGKHFIEQALGETDPAFVDSLRLGAQ